MYESTCEGFTETAPSITKSVQPLRVTVAAMMTAQQTEPQAYPPTHSGTVRSSHHRSDSLCCRTVVLECVWLVVIQSRKEFYFTRSVYRHSCACDGKTYLTISQNITDTSGNRLDLSAEFRTTRGNRAVTKAVDFQPDFFSFEVPLGLTLSLGRRSCGV